MIASTPVDLPALDPLPVVKGLASLRRLTGMYPASHPMIARRLEELDVAVRQLLQHGTAVHIDIIHGHVHLNGVAFPDTSDAHAQMVRDLTDLGIDSIHIQQSVRADELRAVAELLWQLKGGGDHASVDGRLARLNVTSISLGRLVPLDTRWRSQQWPDAPVGPIDPAYAEALARAEQSFDAVTSGRSLDAVTVRELVELLINEVARSNVAISQILALKAYENLTYCHSVNVSMLSLLIGRQIGMDDAALAALVEAALLHDIGKTKIPLEIVKKPGALDREERRLIEAHTLYGAEILANVQGLRPMTPTVALEHHRSFRGGGYPDLGDGVVPHSMSQIVSVADVYEAITGARSYQDPHPPEQACLILARLAGGQLNTALVKAFVAAVTFFPLGSVVRTSLGETAVVIRTNAQEPLHPVIALVGADGSRGDEIDTSERGESGDYMRHILETIPPQSHPLDVTRFM
jgi:putative nucleotidyltransferase with HDIG domain